MTPERFTRLRATLSRRQPDLTVILEQVHKAHNLAAIVRTCDAVGVHELHAVPVPGKWKPARNTSLGSERWLKVHRHTGIEGAVLSLQRKGMQIFAAHLSNEACMYREVDYTRPCAVLFGAEKHGVSARAAALADQHIVIPMLGMAASLNVSVAAGIVLAEAQNQRLEAGCYDSNRLEAGCYDRQLFRWAHPVVAAHCDRRAIPYPELNVEGEIADSSAWMESH